MSTPTPVLQTDWNDFNTIPTLRQFADKIYELGKSYVPLRSQERKADVVAKIQHAFQEMKAKNDLPTYARVRQSCEIIGTPARYPTYTYQAPPPTFGGVPAAASSSSSHHVPRPAVPATTASNGYGHAYTAASGSSRPASGYSSSSYQRPAAVMQDWKANPSWKPIKALTNMEMLPDISASENSHVRRERRTNFSIPNDVIEKLNYTRANPGSHPRYAIRLFCTSSDYYRPSGMPVQPGQGLVSNRNIPIEYPSNPDVSVDNYNLSFKEKGLRGKAGSAPPFDLEKGPNGLSRVPGRMINVIFGHSGPTVGKKKEFSKRFFYQIVFAELTSKEELLSRLNKLEPTSAEESLKESQRRLEEDDDIVVGTSMMSLKDPLSYMRIARPVRSSKCTHIQCFDAQWWIESNAQHPQWLCPHCSRELKFPDLIVDGYVMSILDAVPEEVEEVVLEPSGEWHSEDNKYGTDTWLAKHGIQPTTDTKPDVDTPRQTSVASPSDEASSNKRKIVEVLLSDSEDEDSEQPLAKINGSHSVPPPAPVATPKLPPPTFSVNATASSSRTPSVQPSNAVIDLTLSDSEDDDEESSGPTTSQPAYFHLPGAVSATRNAVESHRPPMNMKTSSGHIHQGDSAARSLSGLLNGSSGTGPNTHWTPYSNGPSINNQWREPPYPSPRPSSAVSSSTGQGMNKRPRADDWMDGPRQQDPASNGSSLQRPSDPTRSTSATNTNNGFAGYSSPLARTFVDAALPRQSSYGHSSPAGPSIASIDSYSPRSGVERPSARLVRSPLSSPGLPVAGARSPVALPTAGASSTTPKPSDAIPLIQHGEGTRAIPTGTDTNQRESQSTSPGQSITPTLPSVQSAGPAPSIAPHEPSLPDLPTPMTTSDANPVPSSVLQPATVPSGGDQASQTPNQTQPKESALARIELEGGGEEPMILDEDETEDEEGAEKSSDLGLGLEEVEDEFWDGVLSGELVL
ncbi:hypothetical protein CI109_102070 [Kwoniella shandongensis]|uniref:Uncharacterized protein n=1 Tax=Kwoniella shandongensis TaxID=1734106 RepID=A0A5M6BSL8_9TREE|nr:uncharacterized protein CI109_006521 [Kwoniella shandongensis]KAA5525151.1 hypothetical protein CI109_006521 [Kwoniella shandongensis]